MAITCLVEIPQTQLSLKKDTAEIKVFREDKKAMESLSLNAENVISLRATDEELEAIHRQFTNIPMHNGPRVEWYGEMARFIARHIR